MSDHTPPRLINLRSETPVHPLSLAIDGLLTSTGLEIIPVEVTTLAESLDKQPEDAYARIEAMDRAIGDVGLHNINRQEGQWLTGNYRLEFRPIFRPIQYAERDIFDGNLIWDARNVVQ